MQWLLSYEAPFEDSIYPGGGAFFTVSVIVYGENAFDAMTHFYLFAQVVCAVVSFVGKVQGRGCRYNGWVLVSFTIFSVIQDSVVQDVGNTSKYS